MRCLYLSRCMLVIALSALLLLTGQAEDSSVKSLIQDLKGQRRFIFGVGIVSSNVALFLSGSSEQADVSQGYQLKNRGRGPADGKFRRLENALALAKYTNLSSSDEGGVIRFLTGDSANRSFLVTMNSNTVNLLDLASGALNSTHIEKRALQKCYHEGDLHLSSAIPGTFYVLKKTGGTLSKMAFEGGGDGNISSSVRCKKLLTRQLCLSSNFTQVTVSSSFSCPDASTPPSLDFTAGFIGNRTAYLFSHSNEVFHFRSEAVESGQMVAWTRVSSSEAWAAESDSSTDDSSAVYYNTAGLTTATVIILGLSLILFCLIVYFLRCECTRERIQVEGLVLYQGAKEESNQGQQQQQAASTQKCRPSPRHAYVTEQMMEKRKEKAKRRRRRTAEKDVSASASHSTQKRKKKKDNKEGKAAAAVATAEVSNGSSKSSKSSKSTSRGSRKGRKRRRAQSSKSKSKSTSKKKKKSDKRSDSAKR